MCQSNILAASGHFVDRLVYTRGADQRMHSIRSADTTDLRVSHGMLQRGDGVKFKTVRLFRYSMGCYYE